MNSLRPMLLISTAFHLHCLFGLLHNLQVNLTCLVLDISFDDFESESLSEGEPDEDVCSMTSLEDMARLTTDMLLYKRRALATWESCSKRWRSARISIGRMRRTETGRL